MRSALATLVATVVLLLPAAASASTAQVEVEQSYGTYYYVAYDAAPGEVNDLTASGDEHGIVLTDPGAEIMPGDGCTSTGAHSVACTHEYGLSYVEADLGDGEDHFTTTGPTFDVDGGPGNDVIDGGQSGGELRGGDGDDELRGGSQFSWFFGGDGADEMTGTDQNDRFAGGPGADTIDGRGDLVNEYARGDVVSYSDHKAGVTIDLSNPGVAAGEPGEGDTISNVESADGGAGPDRITAPQDATSTGFGSEIQGLGGDDTIRGGPGRDTLYGGTSRDWIRGEGGDDVIGGQKGRDTLDGGGGSNAINADDGEPPEQDSVDCGDGGTVTERTSAEPVRDVIDASCRRVSFSSYSNPGVISEIVHGYEGRPVRAIEVDMRCAKRCAVANELHAQGRLAGSAKGSARRGRHVTLTIPLSKAARGELARLGKLKLRLSLVVRWGVRLGHTEATSYYLMVGADAASRR